MRGSLAVALLLLPLAWAGTPEAPDPWWERTLLDADRDGIDDALAPLLRGDAPLSALVAYDRVPGPSEQAQLERAGLTVVRTYARFDVISVAAPPAVLVRALDLPHVVLIEANDALAPQLLESVPLIGATRVWEEYGVTGKGQVVAVLDDGSFEQHPDLQPKIAASFDAGASSGGVPFAAASAVPVVPAGTDGHGTHVAGTIVGSGDRSNGLYRGVAPDARFVNVKVFRGPNQTNSDIVLTGLDWTLDNMDRYGIRVASLSLGGRPSDGQDALSRAVNVAVDEGLVVVAAAGNAGPGEGSLTSPGAAEKAITVGAVDKQKRIAGYSGRGPTLDGRTKPDLVAPGTAITSTVPPASLTSLTGFLGGQRDVFYGELTGTSMAAPHVSGVVALMLEANPDLSPIDVKRILVATAQDLGAPGKQNDTGYGFVNAIAAVQVAQDPTLLEQPQFAAILGTLPEPEKEPFLTRMEFELQQMRREGTLPLYGALLLAALIVVALIGVGATRAVRRRRLSRPPGP